MAEFEGFFHYFESGRGPPSTRGREVRTRGPVLGQDRKGRVSPSLDTPSKEAESWADFRIKGSSHMVLGAEASVSDGFKPQV